MTTMREVGARAGVSAKTVSRVVTGDPHVSPETREHVRAAIRELNYLPNLVAKAFRNGRDELLAVAVPDIADPFFAPMIRSIEQVAADHGVTLIVTGLGRDPSQERLHVEALMTRQVIGLVICPVTHDQSYLERWQGRTPIVFVDREASRLTADAILEDDRGGAYAACSHLISYGHKRIAFIGDTLDVATTRLRHKGFITALANGGVSPAEELVSFGAMTSDQASEEVERLLDYANPPTAIFSSNSRCTMGVVKRLHELDRAEVALVGFGDFPMATVIRPAVTVIDQDPDRLGRAAADRIFLRHNHPDRVLRRKVTLSVDLLVRGSGELPPSPHGSRKRGKR